MMNGEDEMGDVGMRYLLRDGAAAFVRPVMDGTARGRADVHTHTHYSGFNRVAFIPHPESVTPPEKMVDAAVKKGLDVLCITDHNEIAGAFRAQRYQRGSGVPLDVVMGEEITTRDGELLGLFLQDCIPRGLSAEETIDRIHGQGGLAVAPHPFSYRCPSLGQKIKALKLDGLEVLNAAHRDPYVNRLAQLEKDPSVAPTAGSDAHAPKMLGDAFTEFPGRSAEELYQAIRQKETIPQGEPSPLGHWIVWCVEVAHGVFKQLTTVHQIGPGPNNPLWRIEEMSRRNKLLAVGGCMAFLVTPLPLLCGFAAEGWIRREGRKKWKELAEHG
jgi:hypothetical protein